MTCLINSNIKNYKCMETKVKKKKQIKRRFLGKFDNFTDKVDRNFNKKMLKAYLRGNTMFSFGLDSETRQPIMHRVLQEYYEPKAVN